MTARAQASLRSRIKKLMPKSRRGRVRTTFYIAVGIAVLLIIGAGVFAISYSDMSRRAVEATDYVRRQSLVYDSYNDASTSESLMHTTEGASQLARDLQRNGCDREHLAQYADELGLTGAMVLDAQGKAELTFYSTAADEKLSALASEEALVDCANHANKIYAERVNGDDGSATDLTATHRLDAPGTVVAFRRIDAQYAERYTLNVQNLIEGYGISAGRCIVIEQNNRIIAANENATRGKTTGIRAIRKKVDRAVIRAIKKTPGGDRIVFLNVNGHGYFAMMSRARDYLVYVYQPALNIANRVAGGVVIAAAIYAGFLLFAMMLEHRGDRIQLEERIREERAHRERLAVAVEEARAADRAKTDFLRRMSHDIRTPINGILGMVDIAEAYPDDAAKQAECRDKVKGAAKLLTGIVNEVLDMSKLESGAVVLDDNPFDLIELRNEVRDVVVPAAEERHIELIRCDGRIEHRYLRGSVVHIKRLLLSILGNAVKYTNEGGSVYMHCYEASCKDGVAVIRFECRDTGVGMSQAFQKHAFEPFTREHDDAAFEDSGTGLGLPIARNLAHLMGGDITFTSEEGVGPTFVIELPLTVDDSAVAAPVPETAAADHLARALDGMNILLVEDNDLNAEIAQFMVEEAGGTAVRAKNGTDAVAVFKASDLGAFDAVLMDVMMPVMDGYAATGTIRALDRSDSDVPIVGMSANAFADDIRRARAAGMDDYIAKPIDSAVLVKTLVRLQATRKS